MERNEWYNRRSHPEDRNYRNRYENRPVDEDMYRGAYRFDNTSDHHNVSTWDGYGSTAKNRGRSTDHNRNYNQDYNRNYNQDYNRNYNSGNRGGYDHDNYNMDSRYRDRDQPYRTGNTSNWNEQQSPGIDNYGTRPVGNRQHRNVHDRITDHDPYGAGNFSADYGPDHYGHGGGENYGNMAGTLSYGYDGTSNYDPDWNSFYDPLSGHRRSYHGNYTSRHPEPGQYRQNASRKPSDHGYTERY